MRLFVCVHRPPVLFFFVFDCVYFVGSLFVTTVDPVGTWSQYSVLMLYTLEFRLQGTKINRENNI